MIEITNSKGNKIYLPSNRVRLITRGENDELMLCFENSKSEVIWQEIMSFAVVASGKVIS